MELGTEFSVNCASRKTPRTFTVLLACRVGRHNLIQRDEFSDPYGESGGSEYEGDDSDDQGFGNFDVLEEANDLNDELDAPEAFGPRGGLEYNAAYVIWHAMMNGHADS